MDFNLLRIGIDLDELIGGFIGFGFSDIFFVLGRGFVSRLIVGLLGLDFIVFFYVLDLILEGLIVCCEVIGGGSFGFGGGNFVFGLVGWFVIVV